MVQRRVTNLPSFAEITAALRSAGGPGDIARGVREGAASGLDLGSTIAQRRAQTEGAATDRTLRRDQFKAEVERLGQAAELQERKATAGIIPAGELGLPTEATPAAAQLRSPELRAAAKAEREAKQTSEKRLDREKTVLAVEKVEKDVTKILSDLGAKPGEPGLVREVLSLIPGFGDLFQTAGDIRAKRGRIEKTEEQAGRLAEQRERIRGTSTPSFDSVEDAQAANLPVGTRITVQGRPAVITE